MPRIYAIVFVLSVPILMAGCGKFEAKKTYKCEDPVKCLTLEVVKDNTCNQLNISSGRFLLKNKSKPEKNIVFTLTLKERKLRPEPASGYNLVAKTGEVVASGINDPSKDKKLACQFYRDAPGSPKVLERHYELSEQCFEGECNTSSSPPPPISTKPTIAECIKQCRKGDPGCDIVQMPDAQTNIELYDIVDRSFEKVLSRTDISNLIAALRKAGFEQCYKDNITFRWPDAEMNGGTCHILGNYTGTNLPKGWIDMNLPATMYGPRNKAAADQMDWTFAGKDQTPTVEYYKDQAAYEAGDPFGVEQLEKISFLKLGGDAGGVVFKGKLQMCVMLRARKG